MNQEISFTGFTVSPSDYSCHDGALAAAVNVIPEDGALRPLPSPSVVMSLAKGETARYIHKNTGYKNYIVSRDGDGRRIYRYYGEDGTPSASDILTLAAGEEQTDICAIGNTLVISTDANLHYLLFKKGEGYVYLGTELPKPKMMFALSSSLVTKEHKAQLTFSDYQSNEDSFTTVAAVQVTGKYTGQTGDGTASHTRKPYADNVQFVLGYTLEAGTEYRFTSSAPWDSIVIYGSEDGTVYDKLADIGHGGTSKCKPQKNYSVFKLYVLYEGFGYPEKFAFTVTLAKGFTNAVSGKVIEYSSKNYEALFAAVNSFVAKNSTEKDRFAFPFFVRYALRLTDGTNTRMSPPVLMIPNSGYAPLISFLPDKENIDLYAFFSELRYNFLEDLDEKWGDIVSGVDVFVSQPVYPYNQGDAYDASVNRLEYLFINKSTDQVAGTDYTYGQPTGLGASISYGYNKWDICELAKEHLAFGALPEEGDTTTREQWNIVRIAPAEDRREKLTKVSGFYLVHSFTLEECKVQPDIINEFTALPMETGTLKGLAARRALADDSLSGCSFFDARLVNYNSRLHLFDYKMRHAPSTRLTMQEGYGGCDNGEKWWLAEAYVYVKTSQGERVVKTEPSGTGVANRSHWFFYPHNNAYKALLVFGKRYSDTAKYHTVTLRLTQHTLLNGAYWMADDLDGGMAYDGDELDAAPGVTVSEVSEYPASVLQSQAAMPFSFPASLMYTLPVSRVLAMSSAAKALSQGQFGQFPLYAFTAEGVWALEVSTTGTYSARQPITRDVYMDTAGIAQLDTAVLFPTDRGLMLISGSQTQCISDPINSEYPFDATKLPGFTKLHAMLGHDTDTDKCLPTLPFTRFLKECQMIYDYVHQRVIVYSPSVTYAYVYSLKSQQWGMTFSGITAHLNSYPDALAVDASNAVLSYSEPKSEKAKCLYATRPLKLGAPDVLKTVESVIQRGFFPKGAVATVLYGSRDLINWHLVWSSQDHRLRGFRGSPYKYFRIAALAALAPDENVSGASVQFQPRWGNRPR